MTGDSGKTKWKQSSGAIPFNFAERIRVCAWSNVFQAETCEATSCEAISIHNRSRCLMRVTILFAVIYAIILAGGLHRFVTQMYLNLCLLWLGQDYINGQAIFLLGPRAPQLTSPTFTVHFYAKRFLRFPQAFSLGLTGAKPAQNHILRAS
jgi:hypothetical protein